MVTLTNHVIDWVGFTLRGAPGTSELFQNLLAKYKSRPKKVFLSELGASGTVLYRKSLPGYCIAFIKELDDGLR